MQDEAENPSSAWSAAVERLLGELHTLAHDAGDCTLDSALLAAREAMNAWRDQTELLAFHERARGNAMSLELHARQRVSLILDLARQLAALPSSTTSQGASAEGRRPQVASAASGAGVRRTGGSGASSWTPGLAAHLLGAFELYAGGARVTDWRGRRGPTVLQFLASRRGVFVDREVLVEVLWPGMRPDAGRHRLHQAIYALRQTLHQLDPGHEHIVCENGSYRLDPGVPLWTDVAEFDQLAAAGAQHEAAGRKDEALDSYRSAELLYRGDFLENNPFAEWATAERRRVRTGYVVLGNRLGELYAERGDHSATLAVCARVLGRDAWNEEATRRAMRSYVATGNRSLALQLFKSFETELARELGVAPSAEARTLYAEILTPTSSAGHPTVR